MENQKKLERLENFEGVAGPVLTIVMDGVGIEIGRASCRERV